MNLFPEQREDDQPRYDNENRNNKHDQRDTVHAMHIFHPPGAWLIRVSFFDVEVFGYLFPDAHGVTGLYKGNKSKANCSGKHILVRFAVPKTDCYAPILPGCY